MTALSGSADRSHQPVRDRAESLQAQQWGGNGARAGAAEPAAGGEAVADGSAAQGAPGASAAATVPAEGGVAEPAGGREAAVGGSSALGASAGAAAVSGPAGDGADRDGGEGDAATGEDVAAGDSGGEEGGGAPAVVLPEPVRQRVLALASDALGQLAAAEVPATLRPAARFTPAKRLRLAGAALAAALETDAVFRLRAAEQAERVAGSVVDAVRTGVVPAAADPVELAAAAYLLRPEGWPRFVERARVALDDVARSDRRAQRDAHLDRLRGELDAARAAVRVEAERAKSAVDAARVEADGLRRQLREQTGLRRAAERARAAAEEALAEERRRAATTESTANAELRRLRQRLAEAEDTVEAGRRVARESRQADAARLWLLLDTLGGAVHGLRRELALTPSEDLPADSVSAASAAAPVRGSPSARGDDPARLDRLLELPRVHLVVDGYNVTKSGYGDQPLAAQRNRLIRGLGALAARTGVEASCVFDGAARPPAMPPAPRGLRVLFSAPGEPADDLIRRLVAAEPPGRPVVVVSSDREVADDVRRAGAYSIDSVELLRRLDRG